MNDTTTEPLGEPQGDVEPTGESITPDADPDAAQDDAETYPAEVVRKLRDESAGYRTRARDAEARADELARALFTARVAATGKLTDATDLEFDAEILGDPDKIAAAVDSLLGSKPHLRARKVSGDAGVGRRGDDTGSFSLLNRMRGIG